ncbi:conserved protein of unknown function [Tenacibaculum sp. 190130A14a]
MIDQWKNPEIDSLHISKILIVGLSPNIEARTSFEQRLKQEFQARDIEAVSSLEIFDPSFRVEQKSKEEIKVIENILTSNYFDAVLLSKVKGIEDKVIENHTYRNREHLDIKFKDDYYMHQEIIGNPSYYEKYKVYHAESSLYCICPTKDRELMWKGSIDIIDPTSAEETIDDYISLLILALEEQKLLNKKR